MLISLRVLKINQFCFYIRVQRGLNDQNHYIRVFLGNIKWKLYFAGERFGPGQIFEKPKNGQNDPPITFENDYISAVPVSHSCSGAQI